ncbi:50S ribosomal protein L5 [bacterium]|nr:MAG: 50S ribosomal protein L5 [bacterium]
MADNKKSKKTSNAPKKTVDAYAPTLRLVYRNEIVPSLFKLFNYSNKMEVPRLKSITLNMGIGDAKNNSKDLDSAVGKDDLDYRSKNLSLLKQRKGISNFKIRKGWPVGCKVTLRSNRMYEFLERLISIALPRTRDFRGLSFKSFDGRGNYNFGVKEQIIFTEIDFDKIQSIRGLNITITTSAQSDTEAYELLKLFGLPLRDKPKKQNIDEAA